MPLGTDYARQDCSLADALELIGERWTLLILRDAFYGVRRFTDFRDHLDISKAVLTQRLSSLVDAGLLTKSTTTKHGDYALTPDAIALWPAIFALMKWGELRSAPRQSLQLFVHIECGLVVDDAGWCPVCGVVPSPSELEIRLGPGANPAARSDHVSAALRLPRQLLEPLTIPR